MHSTWIGLAFTRFKYLADFQEINKCDSCFVTISNNIQVKQTAINSVYKTNELSSLKMA